MSTIYLAGRFSRRFQLQGVRADLLRAGHTVVSRWIDLVEEAEADAAKCAQIDLADLDIADIVVVFADEPRSHSRGGHWVETGYALAMGKRVLIVGCRANVFCHLPEVAFYQAWPEALKALSPPRRLAA